MAVAAREHPNGRARAVADLIHRSFAGPIGNVLAIGAFLFGTDLFREHPVSTGLYLGMLAFRLAARIVLTLVWQRTQPRAQFPLWLIGLSAYTLSAPTGLYAAYVIRQYGCGDWNTFFIYVFAATCAISGTIAIAPDLRMAVGYQLSLLMPIAFVSLSMGDRHAYILGASTLLFATYALINSVRQNADYWTGVSRDMALQRRAEELQAAKAAADAANRAKSQFLANMSHEIRTPMNGVLGMLELALRDELPEPQRQQLGYAHESAQSLLSLLNAILDHSKAEAGRLELEQTDFDLRETLDNALGPFMSQAAGKGISLTASIDPAVWRFLRGDPTRLRQVLVNLLSNALKFTETGGVRVLVAVEAARAREIVLLFSVTDTGPGIPPEKQGLVFEAFAQGDGTITRRYGGTGLGLAICRDLVQLMGGRIWVESAPGAGSAFHFTATFAPASGKLTQARRVEAEPIVSRPLRILIAEDNRINQKLITEVVKLGGHSSQIAENGQQVVSKCREDCFDLILMDVQMPVMDGLEATRLIRAMQGASGRRTPIIGVTAGATPAELAACLGSGMDSCITKPISIFDLERVFAQVSTGDTAPLTISHNQ